MAPYLVQLAARSPLTELRIREHWGQAGGCFSVGAQRLQSHSGHLRRFLLVKDAQGQDMYFRFYDPRVLRVFLPTCTPEELSDFFGPSQVS